MNDQRAAPFRPRSRRAADRRPVRPRAALRFTVTSGRRDARPPFRSRSCSLRHALGEIRRSVDARGRSASGVMMIPIPRRGIYRGVSAGRGRATVAARRGRPNHGEAGPTARAAARRRQLSGIHLRARPHGPADVESALRAAHAALSFHDRCGIPGARVGANALQSPTWLIPADPPRPSDARRPTRADAR